MAEQPRSVRILAPRATDGYSFREPTIAERLQIDAVLAQVPPPDHAVYAALRLCITDWPETCAGPALLENHLTPAQAIELLRSTFAPRKHHTAQEVNDHG